MCRGWRGKGNWPGAGPFSNLPPWERPGWIYGPGACWYLYEPNKTNLPQTNQLKPKDEAVMLNEQKKAIQETLRKIEVVTEAEKIPGDPVIKRVKMKVNVAAKARKQLIDAVWRRTEASCPVVKTFTEQIPI